MGPMGLDETAEPGVAVAVVCGWGVAPPPSPDCCAAGEALGAPSGADAEADGCGLACDTVAEGEGLADRVPIAKVGLAEGRVAGISCGNANAKPSAATSRMAMAAGAKRRNSNPAANPPMALTRRRRAGSLTSADAGSVVWRQLAASSRSAMR